MYSSKSIGLLIIGVLMIVIPTMHASSVGFSDVAANAWFAGVVESMQAKGILRGYDDGSFRPGNVVTRAELAVVIDRMMNEVGFYEKWEEKFGGDAKATKVLPLSEEAFNEILFGKDFLQTLENLPKAQSSEAHRSSSRSSAPTSVSSVSLMTTYETGNTPAGWRRYSHTEKMFSLAFPADWKGISGYDGSLRDITEVGNGDIFGPQSESYGVNVRIFTPESVNTRGGTVLEYVQQFELPPTSFSLAQEIKQRDDWTIFLYDASIGKGVNAHAVAHWFSARDSVIIIECAQDIDDVTAALVEHSFMPLSPLSP